MRDSMFIGLDVYKATISVAVAQDGRGCEVRQWGTAPHRPDHIRKLVEKFSAGGSRLHFAMRLGQSAMACIASLSSWGMTAPCWRADGSVGT